MAADEPDDDPSGDWVSGDWTDEADRFDAARNRYVSDTWRRLYDSSVWRWVIGPLVYILIGAAFFSLVSNTSFAGSLVFGAVMAAFIAIASQSARARDAKGG